MVWNYLSQHQPQSPEELVSLLLRNRDVADAAEFLDPPSPLELDYEAVGLQMSELDKLVARLHTARETHEKIVVYGDYDCDGVCGTTILWETLFTLGFNAVPFIPHREQHGYGLSQAGVDAMLAQHDPAIVISVDNGITALSQWKRMRDMGITTILTDHHSPDKELPDVDVFLHTAKLCGATVAWMVAREVEKRLQSVGSMVRGSSESRTTPNPSLERRGTSLSVAHMLDLCALATIADQVPLLDANRSFAVYGLRQLNETKRVGLRALIDAAGLSLGSIDTYAVNFAIAPRINAMGRLSHAMDALRALCTRRADRAAQYIGLLSSTNQERQELTQELLSEALAAAKSWEGEHIIVVASPSFHDGVIGLIAGKLTETYAKPTLAISIGSQFAKGSARSVRGVNITDLLRQASQYLLEVGGHPMAAGFKLTIDQVENFRAHMHTLAKQAIDPALLIPSIDIDCSIPPTLATLATAEAITTLAPFGAGNREPILALHKMRILEATVMGKESRHLRLSLIPQDGAPDQVITAIGWGRGNDLPTLDPGSSYSVAGHLSINGWNGKKRLQVILKDLVAA